MPTDKHRYTITSDPEIERALCRRKRNFPGEPRSKILARLIKRGDSAIEEGERPRHGILSRMPSLSAWSEGTSAFVPARTLTAASKSEKSIAWV